MESEVFSVVKPKYTIVANISDKTIIERILAESEVKDITVVEGTDFVIKGSMILVKHDLEIDFEPEEKKIFNELYQKFKEGKNEQI